ncbi:MAG: OmpA family protein [Acidobacteriota bacterium]
MSKLVLILAGIVGFLGALGSTWVSHGDLFSRMGNQVENGVDEATKRLDPGNAPLEAEVERHWIRVKGKVHDRDTADGIGRDLAKISGVYGVINEVESLDVENLQALQTLLDSAPLNLDVDHELERPGRIVLKGRVSNPDLKDRISSAFGSVRGVQDVRWQEDVGKVLERRVRDDLRNIYFDFNKAVIRDDSYPAINRVAEVVNEYPDLRLRIEGHTDSIGGEAYNLDLSTRRSLAVREALIAAGVAGDRLEHVGYGESRPVANNANPEGRAENRRIELVVLGDVQGE